MEAAPAEQAHYRSYMLRVWQAPGQDDRPRWRIELESIQTGRTRTFRDWPALQLYLQRPSPDPE